MSTSVRSGVLGSSPELSVSCKEVLGTSKEGPSGGIRSGCQSRRRREELMQGVGTLVIAKGSRWAFCQ